MPEGSHDLCAGPHANAIAGTATSSSNGSNKERTKHTVNAPLAIEDRKKGRILLASNTFAPCHEAGSAWPRLDVIDMAKARSILNGFRPEYSEYANSVSNSLTMSTHACMEPIPRPRAQPYGGEPLRATTLGLAMRNITNAASAAPINRATRLTLMMFREESMTAGSMIRSTAIASSMPETKP